MARPRRVFRGDSRAAPVRTHWRLEGSESTERDAVSIFSPDRHGDTGSDQSSANRAFGHFFTFIEFGRSIRGCGPSFPSSHEVKGRLATFPLPQSRGTTP